jgi:hypothetical protein
VCSDYQIHQTTEFRTKKSKFSVKVFIEKSYRYILYINNGCNPQMFNYTPVLGQNITGLYLSPPGEAGPLRHNTMFQKNLLLLQGSKIITLNF